MFYSKVLKNDIIKQIIYAFHFLVRISTNPYKIHQLEKLGTKKLPCDIPKLFRTDGTSQNIDGGCLDSKVLLELQKAKNCTKSCIPILFSSLFDTIEECSDYDNHICALSDIMLYAR